MSFRTTTDDLPRDGQLRASLLDTSTWYKGTFPSSSSAFAALFFGDGHLGPFAALNASAPSEVPTPTTPGHGHRSDSWRICIEGSMRVGAQKHGPSAFRFQQGGVIYGADDVAWDPKGGQNVVVMCDRRGSTAILRHGRKMRHVFKRPARCWMSSSAPALESTIP